MLLAACRVRLPLEARSPQPRLCNDPTNFTSQANQPFDTRVHPLEVSACHPRPADLPRVSGARVSERTLEQLLRSRCYVGAKSSVTVVLRNGTAEPTALLSGRVKIQLLK